MFIRESAPLRAPFDSCRQALLDAPSTWMPNLAGELARPDGELTARLGFSVLGVGVTKQVAIQLGEPESGRDWIRVPVRWEAHPIAEAFPVFEGFISLAPVDAETSKLQVTGTYEPPLGRVGASADELLMRRAAKATVRRLVRELSAALLRHAPEPAAR